MFLPVISLLLQVRKKKGKNIGSNHFSTALKDEPTDYAQLFHDLTTTNRCAQRDVHKAQAQKHRERPNAITMVSNIHPFDYHTCQYQQTYASSSHAHTHTQNVSR